ncbi:MAG TPA: DUF2490 domain-containing protein [Flavipsychrobacter sp.]|nr:DUF2490 domain-containing protein [Flavipsychrobacter sp.]
MINSERISILLVSFILPANILLAQGITDMRLRANAGVAYEPTKKIELTARYRLTTYENATRFLRSMFSLNVGYEVMKDWTVGAEYRYNTSYTQDFHRYFLYTRVKYDIGDISLSYRLRYQQDQDYFDAEYLQSNPTERVFRNRLAVKYDLSKRASCYGYADHFTELKNKQFSAFRTRYGAGFQYKHRKRHEVGIEFFVNDEFNQKKPEDLAAIDVSYTYHLRKKKSK